MHFLLINSEQCLRQNSQVLGAIVCNEIVRLHKQFVVCGNMLICLQILYNSNAMIKLVSRESFHVFHTAYTRCRIRVGSLICYILYVGSKV